MLIRYPGGKNKISKEIVEPLYNFLKKNPSYDYRESFFGGGAIGWQLIKKGLKNKFWVNDLDPAVFAIWYSVWAYPDVLIEKINSFKPTVDDFFHFKKILLEEDFNASQKHIAEVAFIKIACHQMSYSGLGPMAASVPGGTHQSGKYHVGCRYNPASLAKKIRACHKLLSNIEFVVTMLDYSYMTSDNKSVLYLDPPYYHKGPELYQYSFTEQQHVEMRDRLLKRNDPWLLSYDDCPEIRELYKFAYIREIPLKYTISGAIQKQELLISSDKDFVKHQKKTIDLFEE